MKSRRGISSTGSELKKSNGLLDSLRNHSNGPARRASQRRQAGRMREASVSCSVSVGSGRECFSSRITVTAIFFGVAGPVCSITSVVGKIYRIGCACFACTPHHSFPAMARCVHFSPGWVLLRILLQIGFIPTLGVVIKLTRWPKVGWQLWGWLAPKLTPLSALFPDKV